MAEERPARFDWRDRATGLLLLLFVGWYVWAELDLRGRPEEDAAMLMRYSRHLAAGHGIVWNIGEKPVDGATDFLFMVVLAAVHGLGLSLETSARAIGLFAHAATVWLVFWERAAALRREPRVGARPRCLHRRRPRPPASRRGLRHAALRPDRDRDVDPRLPPRTRRQRARSAPRASGLRSRRS